MAGRGFNWRMRNGRTGNARRRAANYERVSNAEPDDRLLIDWAYALECAGKPDEAVAKMRRAIKLSLGRIVCCDWDDLRQKWPRGGGLGGVELG